MTRTVFNARLIVVKWFGVQIYSMNNRPAVNFGKPLELDINILQIVVRIYTDATASQPIHCFFVSFLQSLDLLVALLVVAFIALSAQLVRNLSVGCMFLTAPSSWRRIPASAHFASKTATYQP